MSNFNALLHFIAELYHTTSHQDNIALHEPKFIGNEKKYLLECIESGFVSSVGNFVNILEMEFAKFCGSKYAIATTNGTSALHAILHSIKADHTCEVITQSLSFIATSNAISYTGAKPIYIDVDKDSLSLSPSALESFLSKNAIKNQSHTINKQTNKIIKACIPMHTFGHPAKIQEIANICKEWNITLIEDAAESLGSYILKDNQKVHTGLEGLASAFSFNGNKIITCGGGGMIITNDPILAKELKHITTTAKIPHPYEYHHDKLGFNYRLPNINAALALAQLENIALFLQSKLKIANAYEDFCKNHDINFFSARNNTFPNFWLNAIICKNKTERDEFLKISNDKGIMTRPIWKLNHQNPMYQDCQTDTLTNSYDLQDRIVNIPSSARI